MRVAFFGTPEWAVPSLEKLYAGDFDVAAVVTNPDRPAGRGMEEKAPPVKVVAERLAIPVLQPASARTSDFADDLRSIAPDVAVVVAYGKILPRDVLDIPRRGFVNLHFSLLPRYRGAAPVQRALIEGERVTGASIMVLTEGMDEGPLLATHPVEVDPEETAGELGARLAVIGADLWDTVLPPFVSGELIPQDQGSEATYAAKITTDDARIDWTLPARMIHDLVRGLNPAPGAWTTLGDLRIKVWRSAISTVSHDLAPGTLAAGRELIVGTGDGALVLTDVQAAGKKRMSGGDLARGLRFAAGARFG
ncbi:MAG: methionyl-tRNA formyltransferase [Actinomycetota bacterium]|nr:methionyl-tRNA formyltransferase [Actinomycetota bacterium]